MRTTFITLLLCALGLLAARAQQALPTLDDFKTKVATLEGRITDYPSESGPTSGLIYLDDVVTNEDYPKAVTIRPDGTFSCRFPLNHPVVNYLSIGDCHIPFYAEPGGKLAMEFAMGDGGDWESWGGRVRYKGREAQTAQLLADHALPAFGYREASYGMENLQPLAMRDYMMQKLRDALARLDSLRTAVPLTDKAARLMEFELRLSAGMVLFDYIRMTVPSFNVKAHAEKVPAAYYDFLREMPLDAAEALATTSYSVFLNRLEYSFLGYNIRKFSVIQEVSTATDGQDCLVVATQDVLADAEELNRLLGHLRQTDSIFRADYGIDLPATLTGRILRVHWASFDNLHEEPLGRTLYDSLLPPTAERLLRQALDRKFTAAYHPQSLRPQPLPKGPGADIMRRLLAPLRGRYVLVDFWGTGCGPCRQGIEQSTELRQKLKDSSDITFLYVTGTADSPHEPSYNDYVAAHMLGYPSARLPQDEYNYLRELFRFNGIPHYVVFDRRGRLVSGDYNFWNLEQDLQKWLEQEKEEMCK